MQKKKVLIVNDPLQYGGSDLVAVRLQQSLNPDKFECTYCVRCDEKGPMEDEIAATGVRIIHQPNDKLSYLKSYKYYLDLFEREHFDIVHSHLLFYSAIVLLAAKRRGIKKRVAHSHFSQPLILTKSRLKIFASRLYHRAMRFVFRLAATDMLACSQKAGEFLYGKRTFNKRGKVLNNGIETEKFAYSGAARQRVRDKYGIAGDTVLIGHIGRMYYIKNQKYILDIFAEYKKTHPNSKLMLVGEGEEFDEVKAKCHSLGLDSSVIFTGNISGIAEIYSALDCLVFPSVHEGFPLVLVEAQASKLGCLVSDTITKSTRLSDNIEFLSINEPPGVWAEKIDQTVNRPREQTDNSQLIKKYDIKNIALELENIYQN